MSYSAYSEIITDHLVVTNIDYTLRNPTLYELTEVQQGIDDSIIFESIPLQYCKHQCLPCNLTLPCTIQLINHVHQYHSDFEGKTVISIKLINDQVFIVCNLVPDS